MAARGAPTMANSAATKIPFRRISAAMMRKAVTRRPPCCRRAVPTMTDAMCPASTTSISTSSPSMLTCSPGSGKRPSAVDDVRRNCLGAAAPAADDRRCLIEPHRAGQHAPGRRAGGSARSCGDLELVGDAAEQLADDVLERDQSGDPPVVVFDQRLVAAALAQERQQAIGRHRLAHANDRAAAATQSTRAGARRCSRARRPLCAGCR